LNARNTTFRVPNSRCTLTRQVHNRCAERGHTRHVRRETHAALHPPRCLQRPRSAPKPWTVEPPKEAGPGQLQTLPSPPDSFAGLEHSTTNRVTYDHPPSMHVMRNRQGLRLGRSSQQPPLPGLPRSAMAQTAAPHARGSHSFTFWLNLSRVSHTKHPRHPKHPLTPHVQGLHNPYARPLSHKKRSS
jgi:hypothetical protein